MLVIKQQTVASVGKRAPAHKIFIVVRARRKQYLIWRNTLKI